MKFAKCTPKWGTWGINSSCTPKWGTCGVRRARQQILEPSALRARQHTLDPSALTGRRRKYMYCLENNRKMGKRPPNDPRQSKIKVVGMG